jgi:hypothetical protein
MSQSPDVACQGKVEMSPRYSKPQLQMRAIQQRPCPLAGACPPVTEVILNPVTDNVRVISTCCQTVPDYVGMTGGGLYQIQFVVPPAPSNISRCTSRSGNLFVLMSGPASSGSAQLCVQP